MASSPTPTSTGTADEHSSSGDKTNNTSNSEKQPIIKISGIPNTWRATDLRKFFSKFIGEEKFGLFHFKGRREKVSRGTARTVQCCLVKLRKRGDALSFYRSYNTRRWDIRQPSLGCCLISSADGWYPKELRQAEVIPNGHTPPSRVYKTIKQRNELKLALKAGEFDPPSQWPNGLVGTSARLLQELAQKHANTEEEAKNRMVVAGAADSTAEEKDHEIVKDLGLEKAKRLMKNHGWEEGQGLGKSNQGISTPITAHQSNGRRVGIGYEMSQEEEALERRKQNRANRIRKRLAKRKRKGEELFRS
mmetsp:Transcript_15236/g.24790  ORF Transcript_15236/g.24790 Transcript_15236/m.24790 type:complete len:305 (+) Transcript_15236:17-931(+)